MKTRPQVLVLCLVFLAFSGCLGGENEGVAATRPANPHVVAPPGAPATMEPGLARIEVTVLDDEQAPIAGATVGIFEPFELVASTDERGMASFERLQPGAYSVGVTASGHGSAAKRVDVDADGAASLVFILVPLAIVEPYYVPYIDDGFHAACIAPFPFGIVGSCNPASVGAGLGEKSRFTHPAAANLTAYVGALAWQPSQLLGARFMDLEAQDAKAPAEFRGYKTGQSPIVVKVEANGTRAPFNVTNRVDVNYDCSETRLGNCTANLPSSMLAISYQQRFKLYTTHFYNGKPPGDYTGLPDG